MSNVNPSYPETDTPTPNGVTGSDVAALAVGVAHAKPGWARRGMQHELTLGLIQVAGLAGEDAAVILHHSLVNLLSVLGDEPDRLHESSLLADPEPLAQGDKEPLDAIHDEMPKDHDRRPVARRVAFSSSVKCRSQ